MAAEQRLSKDQVLDDEIFLEELDTARWWHKCVAHLTNLKTVMRQGLSIPEFLMFQDKNQMCSDIHNLVEYKKNQYWNRISTEVNLSKEQFDNKVQTSTAFQRIHRKVANAWNADFSFLTRSDPAYKACREVWWSHFRVPVLLPGLVVLGFGGSMFRSSGQRLLVILGAAIVSYTKYDWEFNDYNLNLEMERTLAVLRTPDSQFSRECRLMLKAGDRHHWVLREFYEEHGYYFDDDAGDYSSIATIFPVEFPMPKDSEDDEEETSKSWLDFNIRYRDSTTKESDKEEMDNLGLTTAQQDYLFQEQEDFEGCHHIEDMYIRCMDRHRWKKPQECANLKQQLNRCFYRTQFVLLKSGEQYGS